MATGLASSAGIRRESSKEMLEEKIRLYFHQLTQGCGQKSCTNPHCATGSGRPMSTNEAGANAIVLAQKKATICLKHNSGPTNGYVIKKELQPSMESESDSVAMVTANKDEPMEIESPQESLTKTKEIPKQDQMETSSLEESRIKISPPDDNALTESKILTLLEGAKKGHFKELTSTLWNVFCNPHLLNKSFLLEDPNVDDLPVVYHRTGILVDVESVRRVYSMLYEVDTGPIVNTFANVMDSYCDTVERNDELRNSAFLNHVVIVFENPLLDSPEFLERAYPQFLKMIMSLSVSQKAILVEWYSSYTMSTIRKFVSSLQQLMLITILQDQEEKDSPLQSITAVAAGSHTLMIFYLVNLLIAKNEGNFRPHSSTLLSSIATPLPEPAAARKLSIFQMLLSKFELYPAELIRSPIPLEEFALEPINDHVDMTIDYRRFRYKLLDDGSHMFSFLDHPFVLSTCNKVETIHLSNSFMMFSERQRTLFNTVLTGVIDVPFLLLRIDRENLIDDTLAQLEAIAELNPIDLRKQLRIEFKEEEGIDEGGLQKEFFQLLIEKLFDTNYGMFVYNKDNHFYWFNINSFEVEQEYHLIGILLGLGIYNNIILDVHFPMVVYQMLIGCQPVFDDLYTTHPQIAQSLKYMMEFEGTEESFKETFMSTFSVSYSDMFDAIHTVNLKEEGDTIPVTMANRQEFVDLYTNWLLVESISKQFGAFKNGFDLVMKDKNLADLFSAEELELLICGSREWDFNSLEDNTRYDGFTREHPVIM
jgi:ubiquitin-protein ligase E3 A